MVSANKIILEGSYKNKPSGSSSEIKDRNECIQISIRLRRKNDIQQALDKGEQLTHPEFEDRFGASPDDMNTVRAFADSHHLTVAAADISSRTLKLEGCIKDFEAAFQVKLSAYADASGHVFRGRSGDIYVPENLHGIIEGVFGLDSRPVAHTMYQPKVIPGKKPKHPHVSQSFTANQLAQIYGFPQGVNGSGQSIGIIELGGGYQTADITSYFKQLGIPAPVVNQVLVDGGTNSPGDPNGADGEVMLDIEIAGAVAPGATITVYFAPNTDQGFLDAISQAVHDTVNKPSVISISWGSAEVNWTAQSLQNFNSDFQSAAALGVTICVASGDSGSRDGQTDGKVHVDFPASSPYVLACGGTHLVVSGQVITSETVWHVSNDSATGGGVSEVFPLPAYQASAGVPLSASTQFKGRGVPDVAGNADPASGYSVLVDGQQLVIGGTSAVAPLMAGLIALINQQSKKKAGFINPLIYSTPGLCRDIVQGNNITTTVKLGYTAGPGWDACTGLGVLNKLSTTNGTIA